MKSRSWLTNLDDGLQRQLSFLVEADRLKTVIRGSRIADGSRRENTAEHSWHLALFAMVLEEHAIGRIDIWRVVQMLVLHDLVEIESGDTPLFDVQGSASQTDREQLAADKLFGMLPEKQNRSFRTL